MAKLPQNLTRVSSDVRQKLRAVGADPDFVDFLLGWHGLLSISEDFEENYGSFDKRRDWRTAKQRQLKQKLKKELSKAWKPRWDKLKAQASIYKPPVIESGLFSINGEGTPKRHRPFKRKFWCAVRDLKTYLTQVSKKPHWNLIAEILFPGKTFNDAQAEWSRRQHAFSKFDNKRSIEFTRRFFNHFRSVILKVLTTGVPIWDPCYRQEIQELVPIDTLKLLVPGKMTMIDKSKQCRRRTKARRLRTGPKTTLDRTQRT